MTMLAGVGSRLGALVAQRAVQVAAAGLLSGAVAGGAVVASGLSPFDGKQTTAKLAILACPGAGPELAHIPGGQTLLVTARSVDGHWLEVYVGEPGVERGWAQASALRLQSAPDGLPVGGCVQTAAVPSIAPAPRPSPSPEPGPSILATVGPSPTPAPTLKPGQTATPTPRPTPTPTLKPGQTPTPTPHATPTPTPHPTPTPTPTPSPTPSPTPTATPVPPPDLTPPSITGVSITGAYYDGSIDYYICVNDGLCAYPSATIGITVTDAGGSGVNLSTVILHWIDPTSTGHQVQMGLNLKTHRYNGTINTGSGWPDGNIQYWVTASDNAGNGASTSSPPDSSHWLFKAGSCLPPCIP